MNNPKKILLLLLCMILGVANAYAVIDFSKVSKERDVTMIGFTDYPPFGYATYAKNQDGILFIKKRHNIFENMLDTFARTNNITMRYTYNNNNYNNLVRKVRSGEIDIILGMYHETKLYEGLDYIVPALISNPVTLIMLPSRVKEIKNISDLKKLKGAILSKEHFSDYVNKEMGNFNLEKMDDTNEMFRKLFQNEIDYIFAGYYTGIIESSKLGLRNYVSFSKQIIWDMPMFIGISKLSPQREFLIQRLGKNSEQKEVQEQFKQNLVNELRRYELLNSQTVPPMYTK